MKPLRTRLQEARKRLGLPWEVLERDYLLSWILAGINQVDALRGAPSVIRTRQARRPSTSERGSHGTDGLRPTS
jgi:hypothetical protein